MADIFLSYAREDSDRAKRVAQKLTEYGWEVWWDTTVTPGSKFRAEIARELHSAKCVVVLWSKTSIESDWVIDEAEDGRRRGVLVHALVDDVLPPHGFRQIHWADLSGWRGQETFPEFNQLRNGIERYVALRITNDRVQPTPRTVTPIDQQQVPGKAAKRNAISHDVATGPVSRSLAPRVPRGIYDRLLVAIIVGTVAFVLSGGTVVEVLRQRWYPEVDQAVTWARVVGALVGFLVFIVVFTRRK